MAVKDIPILGKILGTLDDEGIDYGQMAFIFGVVFFFIALGVVGLTKISVFSMLLYTMPIWLPYVTFWIFYEKWMFMIGLKFAESNGRSIVEMILPPEVNKSPEAMEFFFTQIHNAPSPDNLWQAYIDGKKPLPYTFEIVSRGGDIHFYITVPEKFIPSIKSNLYAQYPGIELKDVSLDYTAEVPSDLKGWEFMSFHLQKKEADVIPILTYKDLKMDMLPKEEEKLDPITPMLEAMATVKPGHQVWVQFICIAHKKQSFKSGSLKTVPEWTKAASAKIDEIMQRDKKTKTGPGEFESMPRLTTGERDLVEAIERNSSKYAFETAIRYCYMSDKEGDFDGGIIPRMNRTFAQTEAKGRNGLGIRWRTDFNYKWFSDPFSKKIPYLKKAELGEYKKRKLNPKSDAMTFKVFSVEEMATLFHPPGLVALTPTLNRVESTKQQAPSNLPTGLN